MVGRKFGKLTVIGYAGKTDDHKSLIWLCECECGNECKATSTNLRSGRTKSCGCLLQGNPTHGKSHSRLYGIWKQMKGRCKYPNNVSYKYYGAKGIKVCDAWNEFEPFYNWSIANGYKDNLTIDRIDSNGNYEPSNCRWATTKMQARNTSRNRYVTIRGKNKTIAEWSDISGVDQEAFRKRLIRGWAGEKLLEPSHRS